MSDPINSWFHCGHCGSLFESPVGERDDRLCPECGRSPSLGFELSPVDFGDPTIPKSTESEDLPEVKNKANREHHSQRKRKKSHLMLKLVAGWTAVLVAIIIGAQWMFQKNQPTHETFVSENMAKSKATDDELAFVNEVMPACNQVFSGFLAAGTPEARNQFVLSPITTASKMARFYSLNPITMIDPAQLKLSKSALLQLPGKKALEMLWTTSDGREYDAVFMKEGGEWRLDWDHFVRYSDYPWALFLAGSGDDQGEFRLLARERLADERKDSDDISIVLYAPRFGNGNETGFQSPEFLVKRESDSGKLLDAAFKLERKGERVYGVKIPLDNSEGMIRVRVIVKRAKNASDRHFEIEKVVACHWYSIDDPGVIPDTNTSTQAPPK